MKKFLSKISLRNQCLLSAVLLLVLIIIIFIVLTIAIHNTVFFQNHSIIYVIIFWVSAATLYLIALAFIFDAITSQVTYFVGYIKEFDAYNFDYIAQNCTNNDCKKLANSLYDVQLKTQKNIDDLTNKNLEITRLMEEQRADIIQKRQMVSAISHDIKTPLTIIHATASGIRDNIFPEDQVPQELENILDQVERTTTLLQNTIALYQTETGNYQLNFQEISLSKSITEIAENLQKLVIKYEQKLYLELNTDILIMADEEQFSRAITNLILNALVHSPKGNEVHIHLLTSAQNAILEIINTGVTIPQKELSNIFLPFYQVDKARTKTSDSGNGLGLYIANEIIKKHGFSMDVENLDNAVKFYIIFPNKKIKQANKKALRGRK